MLDDIEDAKDDVEVEVDFFVIVNDLTNQSSHLGCLDHKSECESKADRCRIGSKVSRLHLLPDSSSASFLHLANSIPLSNSLLKPVQKGCRETELLLD